MARGLTIPTTFTAVDKFSGTVNKMIGKSHAFERSMLNVSRSYLNASRKAAMFGIAVATPLGLAVNEAVRFEDKMADVAKTTGLSGKELTNFGDEILHMSGKTRTSIEDLAKISQIGGQLGVTDGLLEFVEAADQFNVALGSDFSGGVEEAVSQVGKLKNLFKDTRDLKIDKAITKAGSAINFLGSKGAGTSANITEFALRIGAMPDALKPSIQSTLALGTFLQEMGVDAERGSSGFSNFTLIASRDLGKFSKQIGITQKEAKDLLKEDPSKFAFEFAQTFKGADPDELGKKLKSFGLNSNEVIKVIGALSSDVDRLGKLQGFSNDSFKEGISLQEEFNTKNNTSAANMKKMRNQFKSTAIILGNTLLPIMNDVMNSVSPVIESFRDWSRENKGFLKTILKTVGAVSALALSFSAVTAIIGGVAKMAVVGSQISSVFKLASMELKGFNAVMKIMGGPSAGTIGLVIAGAALLYKTYDTLNSVYNRSNRAMDINKDATKTAMLNTVDQRVEVNALFKALENSKIGTDNYAKAVGRLEEIQPGITDKFSLTEQKLRDLKGAYDSVTESIIKQAKQEYLLDKSKSLARQALIRKESGPSIEDYLTSIGLTVGTLGIEAISPSGVRDQDAASLSSDAEETARQYERLVNPKKSFLDGIGKSIKEKIEIIINNNSDSEVTTNGGLVSGQTSNIN